MPQYYSKWPVPATSANLRTLGAAPGVATQSACQPSETSLCSNPASQTDSSLINSSTNGSRMATVSLADLGVQSCRCLEQASIIGTAVVLRCGALCCPCRVSQTGGTLRQTRASSSAGSCASRWRMICSFVTKPSRSVRQRYQGLCAAEREQGSAAQVPSCLTGRCSQTCICVRALLDTTGRSESRGCHHSQVPC